MPLNFARARRELCTLVLFALAAACAATPTSVPSSARAQYGRVAVVAADALPKVAFEGLPHSKGEAAATNARVPEALLNGKIEAALLSLNANFDVRPGHALADPLTRVAAAATGSFDAMEAAQADIERPGG